MAAGQWELGASGVVEGRGHPAHRVVAIDAMGAAIFRRELTIVCILVAGFAEFGCAFEAGLVASGGLMAIRAGHRAMGSEERERSFRMIEAVDICPGFCGVAGLAAEGRPAGALADHAVVEFAVVGIVVAGGAAAVLEMERNGFVHSARRTQFVAIGAGNGDVSAG